MEYGQGRIHETFHALPFESIIYLVTEEPDVQHPRLAPQPPIPPVNQGPGPGAGSSRLGEFFDLIRSEFEVATQDGNVWKEQRDQYEAKCAFHFSLRGDEIKELIVSTTASAGTWINPSIIV